MEKVLYDLHRADGILQTAGMNHAHDTELALYYQAVLDRHGITQAQFDSSLVWYTDNPQIFNKIYPRVVTRLEKDQAAYLASHGKKQVRQVRNFVPQRIDTLINPQMYTTYPPIIETFVKPQTPFPTDSAYIYSLDYLEK